MFSFLIFSMLNEIPPKYEIHELKWYIYYHKYIFVQVFLVASIIGFLPVSQFRRVLGPLLLSVFFFIKLKDWIQLFE